jgi:hypothetical protein
VHILLGVVLRDQWIIHVETPMQRKELMDIEEKVKKKHAFN